MFRKLALFPFAGTAAPNVVYPLDWAIISHCAP